MKKVIHVRPTWKGESFNNTDLYIAWVDDNSAGRMAATAAEAVAKIIVDRHHQEYSIDYP